MPLSISLFSDLLVIGVVSAKKGFALIRSVFIHQSFVEEFTHAYFNSHHHPGRNCLLSCAAGPNKPMLVFETAKRLEQFTAGIVPKIRAQALSPALTQTQPHYRIVVTSRVAMTT